MSELDPNSSDTPPPLNYARRPKRSRFGSWFNTWAAETFSKEQLISSFKSFLWVAPLTILIWVYAEREQTDTVGNQVIIFELKSNDPRMLIKLIDPPEGSLMAELRGARVQVDLVKDLLTPKGDRPPVSIPISPTFRPGGGPYTVPASLIGDQDIFKNNNVSVANVSPSQIKFNVDVLKTVDLDVQGPPQSAMPNLSAPPVIEPRKVQITGPQSVLDTENSSGNLRVVADFAKYPEMSQPGTHTLTVPLVLPFTEKNVSLSSPNVKVTVEITKLESDYKFNSIPVAVTYPAGLERKYYADIPQGEGFLRFVTVIGPKDTIAQMSQPNPPPDLLPKARIEVSSKDVSDPPQERKVRVKYELPPGVRVSPADENREVPVTLRPQTAPE